MKLGMNKLYPIKGISICINNNKNRIKQNKYPTMNYRRKNKYGNIYKPTKNKSKEGIDFAEVLLQPLD